MKVIALANQKGGVAKTTSTYNISAAKALEGYRVLMIDLDPQASLTIMCGIMPGKSDFSVCNLFDGKSDPTDCAYLIPALGIDNLYIISSDIELAEVEQRLSCQRKRESRIKEALKSLEEYFDYVFIDCPPQLSVLTENALAAADSVIIPSKAEYLSYRGVRALKKTIRGFIEDGTNKNLILLGFIITMYEKQVNDQRDLLQQFEKEAPILGTVKKSADAYRSVLDGTPVVISNKKCDVAVAYTDIAKLL